jgi:hypothetical protein
MNNCITSIESGITATKRIFARVTQEVHTEAKIESVKRNMRLEDWLAEAVHEKLGHKVKK